MTKHLIRITISIVKTKPIDTSLWQLPEWNPKLKGGKTMKKDTIVVIGEALVSVVAEIWKDRNEKKEGESNS